MLVELAAAVSALQAAGAVTGSVGDRLDRLVADVADAIEVGEVGEGRMVGYVVGSLAGQACGMAELAQRDGDGEGAGRWRDVARGARGLASVLVAPATG